MLNVFKKIGVFILVCLACWQCHSPQYSGKLREVLEMAGENRGELEWVLAHYAGEAGDSLKWQAACFLIENMPGHYTAHGRVLDSLRGRVDGDAAGYFAQGFDSVTLSLDIGILIEALRAAADTAFGR